jgi:hypothetical protein
MKTKALLTTTLFLGMNFISFSQIPGTIYTPASPATNPLDINGDGWITGTGAAFLSNDHTENEIGWSSIPQVDGEPSGDLSTGGACGTTDIMDDFATGSDATYIYFSDPDGTPDNGDEYMMYRIRIAKNPGNGNFGFSVLMDTEASFGAGTDTNAITGNPGFEIEIRVKNGGGTKGVYLDGVDGMTTGTNKAFYSLTSNTMRSYALNTNASCLSNDPVFYDFFIPMSDLNTYFGVTSTTPIRVVGATSINGSSSLSNGKSDIAGIDDGNYANSIAGTDLAYTALINSYSPIAAGTAGAGSSGEFGVLPVELVEYNVEMNNNETVELNWLTAGESGSDYYMIQHSNGVDLFSTIETVKGAGTTTEMTEYRINTQDVIEGVNYYRLLQVDFDGTVHSLGVRQVLMTKEANGNVFFSNQNNLRFESIEKVASVEVYSMEGKLIHTSNDSQDVIDFSHIETGVYMYHVQFKDGETRSDRFIKR